MHNSRKRLLQAGTLLTADHNKSPSPRILHYILALIIKDTQITRFLIKTCFWVFLSAFICSCQAVYGYSWQDLTNIGLKCSCAITSDFQRLHNIPVTRPAGSLWVYCPGKQRRRWRERKQKPGCRSGILDRRRKYPHNPPLPSNFLTIARSISNKMDELVLLSASNRYVLSCGIMIITEIGGYTR